MKKFVIVLALLFGFFFPAAIHAEYVLPYPSYMPGNKLYKVSKFLDVLKKYWSWGTMAQTKYQLALSDKYLVEAKTLFEYRQYLLAASALERSGNAFGTLGGLIAASTKEGKDVTSMVETISEAAKEHDRVLEMMKQTLPDSFTWTPEKEKPTELSLRDMVTKAMELRTSVVREIKAF